jgi:hypothetical protein
MSNVVKQNVPIIILALLSPVIAELLSGSSPPLEFFNPFGFMLLVGLYGSGVIIVRELCIKWKKGWESVLLLGAAYGIIEEGLAVKSFFDPNWMDLGVLGTYGRWIGVNWVWSFCLTIFHAIYSIVIPILIFSLIFPSLKNKRLLSDKGLAVCFAILLFIVGVCYFFLTPYRPNALLYLTTTIVVTMLVVASWKVKTDHVTTRNVESIVRPIWFGAVGIAFGFLFFFIMYAVPHLVPFPIIPILLEGLLCLLVLLFVVKYFGHTKNFSHKLAFTSGLLSPLIFLAFIHEINGIYGMSIVGIFFIVFLIYLRKKIGYYQRRIEESKEFNIDFE